MKILVPVKRVVDYNVKIRVRQDGSGVELTNVKMSMNPFDEISVEEAIRLKEAGKVDEIIAVSVGPAKAEETIRTALAMGADRGILIQTDDLVEPLAVAKILTFASEIEIGDGAATITREVDGGLQTIEIKLPAIVTTDLRLNEPRYASLPNIMKAKKKPLDKKTPAAYGVDTAPSLKVLTTEEPSGRKAGVKVASVAELVDKLKNEAGVL